MVRKWTSWIAVGLILLFLTGNAHAFDGQRKGFILGFGLGSGFVSIELREDREYEVAVTTDGRIGYAISNSWQIYWTFKDAQLRMHKTTRWLEFQGIGCSYYFKPEAASRFVAVGIGSSHYGGGGRYSHLGAFAGGGLEFSRHLSLETYLSWHKTRYRRFVSFRVSINVLGY
jgi:hypothetical protein